MRPRSGHPEADGALKGAAAPHTMGTERRSKNGKRRGAPGDSVDAERRATLSEDGIP